MVAERARWSRRPCCEGRRQEGKSDPAGVGEHVARVGQQSERPGQEPADDLNNEDHDRDAQDSDELAAMPAGRGPV